MGGNEKRGHPSFQFFEGSNTCFHRVPEDKRREHAIVADVVNALMRLDSALINGALGVRRANERYLSRNIVGERTLQPNGITHSLLHYRNETPIGRLQRVGQKSQLISLINGLDSPKLVILEVRYINGAERFCIPLVAEKPLGRALAVLVDDILAGIVRRRADFESHLFLSSLFGLDGRFDFFHKLPHVL
jgi:hypothetical protein